MPVWHDMVRRYREEGRLTLIGITQEQHPERLQLYAQWQGLDWPILWDPLNLTESKVVPRFIALDEFGVVRANPLRPGEIERPFLNATFEAPPGHGDGELPPPAVHAELLAGERADDLHTACAELLFGDEADLELGLERFERLATEPADHFRLGVALRMRADSSRARHGDFQRAIDGWATALALDPNQYIWRRRLQQYGPRLDKPYPFYDWVERARAELLEQGLEPVRLRAALSSSETAQALKAFEAAAPVAELDPEGAVDRDRGELIELESAVTFSTGSKAGPSAARVHLALRPLALAHWNNEAEDLRVWLDVPEGWAADRRTLSVPNPPEPEDDLVRRLDFELRPPEGASGAHTLGGYALYFVCEERDGTCLYRRQDFELDLVLP